MTSLTSGKYSHPDPLPFKCGMKPNQNVRHTQSEIRFCNDPILDERTTHNPILVNYRAALDEELPFTEPAFWLRGLDNPSPGAWAYATPEHIAHARRVLLLLKSASGGR